MTRFIIIRILQSIVALLGIIVLVFFLERASGNPLDLIANPSMTPQQVETIKARWGLDKSWGVQFAIYMRDILRGNLGNSLVRERPVIDMIKDALPNTLKLIFPAFFFSMLFALVLGVTAATFRDSFWDNGVKFLAVLGQALPGFWVAIMAVLIFSVNLHWLPVAGMAKPANYVLPVGTLVFFILPGMLRLVRSGMLDVLDSEYIKLARIKGLPERMVIWKHALRNALISPLTVAGMIFAMLITGAVITEIIFNWPGMGRLLVTNTFARDFAVVQAISIIVALFVLSINLLVDISYAFIDPQIRYQRA
jgi:peptide/nickel transport system permease protein